MSHFGPLISCWFIMGLQYNIPAEKQTNKKNFLARGCFIKQVYQTSQAYFSYSDLFLNELKISQTNWNKPD